MSGSYESCWQTSEEAWVPRTGFLYTRLLASEGFIWHLRCREPDVCFHMIYPSLPVDCSLALKAPVDSE